MASSTSGAAFLFTPDSPPASGGTLPENPHTPTPAPRVSISGTSAMLTTPGSDMSDWVPNDLAMASPTVFDNFPDLSTPQTTSSTHRRRRTHLPPLHPIQSILLTTMHTTARTRRLTNWNILQFVHPARLRTGPARLCPGLARLCPGLARLCPASPSPLVPDFSTSSWRDIPGHPWPQAQRLPLPLQGYSPDDADDDSASVKGGLTRPGADEIDNVGMQDVGMQDVEMQDDDAQDDDQVGGGRRRSATPPETLSPTRLRTRIKLTLRAGCSCGGAPCRAAAIHPTAHHRPSNSGVFPCVRILRLLSIALCFHRTPAPPPARPFPPHRSHPSLLPPPHFTLLHSHLALIPLSPHLALNGRGCIRRRWVQMHPSRWVQMHPARWAQNASVEMGVDASGEMGADATGEMGAGSSGEMGADASVEMRADASDAADDFSDGDEVESPRRGRPDKTTLDAVAACHAAMDALVKNCALATGLSRKKILCSYANTLENRAEELVRADTAAVKANPSFVSVPTPAGKDPRALTPDEEHTQLLDDWEALERLSNEISIGTRHCQFTRTTRDIIGMLKKFAMKFGFHSLFIMTGFLPQRGWKLAVLHSTGGLQKLLSTLRSDLNDHDVVAPRQLAAYHRGDWFHAARWGRGRADGGCICSHHVPRQQLQSVGKAEKVYKGRNAPQPEVIDLTTLPVKKREQVLHQLRHQKSVDDTHSLQDIMTGASNEDRLDVILSEGDFIIKNFPASVRHPAQMPATRATSAWRVAERDALRTALAARTGGPHQGLRVERRKYEPGAVVIYSHDYTLTPPEGPPDSPLSTATDGNRAIWHMQYDLDAPLQHSPRTLVQAGTEAGLNDEEEQEDSDEDSPAPENGRGKAKDKGKGKEKEKVKRKRKDADKDEEATMPAKRAKKTAPRATSTRPVLAQAPMQEGGGHRGSAMRDLDGDRADNGEDTLPRPLKSALAGSRLESQRKDQSVRWDNRRAQLPSYHCDPAAMPVDDGNESELTPLPSPRPQPVPPPRRPAAGARRQPSNRRSADTSVGRQADSSAKPVDDGNESELTPPPSPRPRPQPVPPPRRPAAGARRQPANWRSADMSVGCQVDSSAKHKADTSGSRERVPAASTTLPPTSITRRVTRSSTTRPHCRLQQFSRPSQRSRRPLQTLTKVANRLVQMQSPPPRNSHGDAIQHQKPAAHWPVNRPLMMPPLAHPPPPANNTNLGAPPPPANDTALGAPPLASFGPPGPLLSAVSSAGLPTHRPAATPIVPAAPPIVPAAPAVPLTPLLWYRQWHRLITALQNIKK
ncbi:hypothetical protein B0H14DRAFT_3516838 [Mycena olivaceomarginata]|nr:hypothetical protein B0H14DRAFT_3516838 [Mycena olivaceomarginata]